VTPGAWLLLALIALPLGPVAAPGVAWAQATARAEETPAPVPVGEVTLRAEEVGAFLRAVDAELHPGPQIARIEAELPAQSQRLTKSGRGGGRESTYMQ
jgi:hypothetical protein